MDENAGPGTSLGTQHEAGVGIQERLDLVRDAYIESARDDECRALLDRILCRADEIERRSAAGTTKILDGRAEIIIGESGSGKSTMINHALIRHPEFSGYAPGPYPTFNKSERIINISVRAPCTVGNFGIEILTAAGYPILARKPDARVILPLARDYLRRRNIQFIIIDEVHALTRSKNNNELAKIQDFFRSLLNDPVHPMQLVFVGTEAALHGLNDSDGQLLRRCNILRLPPFSTGEAVKALKIIKKLAKAAAISIGDDRPDVMAARLIHACRGRLGLMAEMTVQAIEYAMSENTSLTTEIYARIYARQKAVAASRNPFVASDFRHIVVADLNSSADIGPNRSK